jgi:hypothetical protein
MIYVIGDSHAMFYQLARDIVGIHVGPATAYNLINPNSKTQARKKVLHTIEEKGIDEKYVLLFGEIDCRNHICSRYAKVPMENLKPFSFYVKPTTKRYFKFLDELWNRNLRVVPMTIPPAGEWQVTQYGWHHPTSAQVRSKIYACFNDLLKCGCRERGKPCIDFYDRVVGEDGLIRPYYTVDSCHLKPIVIPFLVDELKCIGWM